MHIQLATVFTTVSATPADLGEWERITRSAQIAAYSAQTVLALAGSWQALAIARQLVACPPAGREDDCIAALVVSHHNLADLQLENGARDLAAQQLGLAHEALMQLVQGGRCSQGAHSGLQPAAWRHSRETHAALLGFIRDHGPHPAISRALQAGCLTWLAGQADAGATRH